MTLVQGIDHLGLTVSDLEASAAFFTQCLGFELKGGKPDYPSVFVGNGHAIFTLWQRKEGDAEFNRHAHIGLHHVALKVLSESDLNTLFSKIKDWPGVRVEFAPEFSGKGPKVHFMIFEPGGCRMEFSYDPR